MFKPLLSPASLVFPSTAWHDASTCFSSKLGGGFARRRSSNFFWRHIEKKLCTLITRNVKMPCHTTLALYLLSGHSMLSNFLLSPCLTTGENHYDCMTVQRCAETFLSPSTAGLQGFIWFLLLCQLLLCPHHLHLARHGSKTFEKPLFFFSGKYFRHIWVVHSSVAEDICECSSP